MAEAEIEELRARLTELEGVSNSQERTEGLRACIDDVAAQVALAARGLGVIAEHLASEAVPQLVARPAMTHMARAIIAMPKGADDAKEDAGNAVMRAYAGQQAAFEDADFCLREGMFQFMLAQQRYREAALVLGGFNFDTAASASSTGTRRFEDEEKVSYFVTIAETFLEDDCPVDAENFVNKAAPLMDVVADWKLQLRFRVTYARILDANRKFLDAAMRYYDLSQTQQQQVVQDDLLELLGKAVTCAVLGKAGPQRSRVLGLLCKDERIGNLSVLPHYEHHAKVLQRMYREELLHSSEMEAFESSLMPHHKALLPNGMTIPRRAAIEHNMVAISRIYNNIHFEQLGRLLEVEPNVAERFAAQMITEGRLAGSIDQTEGLLHLEQQREELVAWDERIDDLCRSVVACVETVCKAHPELVPEDGAA